jgi:glycosyltransferase involved in cell wall biosynthesis
MIKIAHFVEHLGYGGIGEVVLNICKFIDRASFKTIVVTGKDGPMREEIKATKAKVYVEYSWDGILRHLRKADLINIHWAKYEKLSYNLIRSLKKPFLITLHRHSILPDIPEITICPSRSVYEIQGNRPNFVIIPNGIDLEKFRPKPDKEVKDKVILTRICRPEKCDPYFWYAIYEVLARRNNVELWIVGEEGESKGRVKFMGIRRDIPEILHQTDIFVYTPRPKEGANDLVVMEAMACGVPPVLSDVEYAMESITHMKDGILVPYGKVSEYADAVIELIDDLNLRKELGENAANKAREQFDARRMTKAYEDLYMEVLERFDGSKGGIERCGQHTGYTGSRKMGIYTLLT